MPRRELAFHEKVEQSIITKYRKELWHPFIDAVTRYELIQNGDRIAVLLTGGKDSFFMAKVLQELHRHGRYQFEIQFLIMDHGFSSADRSVPEETAAKLHLPAEIIQSTAYLFFEENSVEPSPKLLFKSAKEHGCNKIAVADHFDDVIETTLLHMFYGSSLRTLPPKQKSEDFEGMELIRPIYRVHEQNIDLWAEEFGLVECDSGSAASSSACDPDSSGRKTIRRLIRRMKQDTPDLDQSIFNSMHVVDLDTVPGIRYSAVDYSFADAECCFPDSDFPEFM
ncbi:MAG: ATP-binding protein [Lachnospiraceae bacterium]|nr:ATP-binding protein [Lachnospiraceae bacterium]